MLTRTNTLFVKLNDIADMYGFTRARTFTRTRTCLSFHITGDSVRTNEAGLQYDEESEHFNRAAMKNSRTQ